MSLLSGVRFAPSPTGAFHVGNFRTAWISHELAKSLGQDWIVRFEDIDGPRVVAGARERQAAEMAELGWVPKVTLLQTDFRSRHWSTFVEAVEAREVYPCTCSRKEVRDAAPSAPHGAPPRYTGKCRGEKRGWERVVREFEGVELGWRLKMPDASGAADPIVARTRGSTLDEKGFVPGYHWACGVDDWDGNYAWLVRAWDLEHAEAVQRVVRDVLNKKSVIKKPDPRVFHSALVVDDSGHRLEKRTLGVTLPELRHQGWTTERLLGAFSRSFEGFASGSESRRELRLSDLLR